MLSQFVNNTEMLRSIFQVSDHSGQVFIFACLQSVTVLALYHLLYNKLMSCIKETFQWVLFFYKSDLNETLISHLTDF